MRITNRQSSPRLPCVRKHALQVPLHPVCGACSEKQANPSTPNHPHPNLRAFRWKRFAEAVTCFNASQQTVILLYHITTHTRYLCIRSNNRTNTNLYTRISLQLTLYQRLATSPTHASRIHARPADPQTQSTLHCNTTYPHTKRTHLV